MVKGDVDCMTYGIMSDDCYMTFFEANNEYERKDALLNYGLENTNIIDRKLKNAIKKDCEYTCKDIISFINANVYSTNNKIVQVFEISKIIYDNTTKE